MWHTESAADLSSRRPKKKTFERNILLWLPFSGSMGTWAAHNYLSTKLLKCASRQMTYVCLCLCVVHSICVYAEMCMYACTYACVCVHCTRFAAFARHNTTFTSFEQNNKIEKEIKKERSKKKEGIQSSFLSFVHTRPFIKEIPEFIEFICSDISCYVR